MEIFGYWIELGRLIGLASTVATVPLLVLAFVAARRPAPVRTRLDLARLAVSVAGILAMAWLAGVWTPGWLIAVGTGLGAALGYGQGWTSIPARVDGRILVRASGVGLAAWGAGVVVTQGAGILSRTGVVQLGQAVSWFGAGVAAGLLLGRGRRLRRMEPARQALAAAAAAVVGVLMLPVLLATGGSDQPARAAQIEMTSQQICELIPAFQAQPGGEFYNQGVYKAATAGPPGCQYLVVPVPDASLIVIVTLHSDDAAARAAMSQMAAMSTEAGGAGAAQSIDLGDEADNWTWTPSWDPARTLYVTNVRVGPFTVKVEGNNAETIPTATAMTQIVQGVVADTAPAPAPPAAPGEPESAAPVAPVAPVEPAVSDDGITPAEAAGQSAAGLAAAAGVGLISWVQAAGSRGSRGPRGGGPPPAAPEPFIDPLDGKPLVQDEATGMVFWPWDGQGGHWVTAQEAPALIRDWDAELEAENARRIAAHNAQRERNWADLTDRIARSQQEDAARRAAEQSRLADFDRRIEAARGWMEEADAGSLGQLDRITAKVADQGFVTDLDLDSARRIADRARIWVAQRAAEDAADWARIEGNRAAVIEIAAKGAAMLIDPTKGLASGFIFGATESWQRGDSMAAVVGNGMFDAALQRGGHAVGTWGRGQAALGKIGWGALSEAATAAAETAIRGGTAEEAWTAAQTGLVLGGFGGLLDEAVGAPAPRPPEVPTIHVRPGGPRVGYDQPIGPRRAGPGIAAGSAAAAPSAAAGPEPQPQPQRQPQPFDGRDAGTPEPQPARLGGEGTSPQPDASALSREDLLEQARPTRSSREILDRMMAAPSHPAAPAGRAGAADWQRGFFPDAHGRTLIDDQGRVIVGNRQVGAIDPATGTVRNLAGEPVRIAEDGLGTPVGYIEQPRVPEGMRPVYNGRGELAGYVDAAGRADIGGQRVPVAIDADGRLVPHEPVARPGPPVEHMAPAGLRDQARLPGEQVPPATAAGPARPADASAPPPTGAGPAQPPASGAAAPSGAGPARPADAGAAAPTGAGPAQPPASGPAAPTRAGPAQPPGPGAPAPTRASPPPVDHTPYGAPLAASDGRAPASLADLDTAPRIPVLDADGSVAHLVEPGPREIHYDAAGRPRFVQRQYPVRPSTMRDIVLPEAVPPASPRVMPTPEVWDLKEVSYPLTGDGAPPAAPPAPTGGAE